MENRYVGFLIIGIALVLVLIIFLFQTALKEIVLASCGLPHAVSCPMNETIKQQTYLALGIVGILFLVGLVMVFNKPKEKIILKRVKEKKIIELMIKEGNAMFQSNLMEKLEIGKVKATRLLDKLEAKQLIERKRRGMNNIVVLKG